MPTETAEPAHYYLDAQVWQRDSTQEWVLELSGTINDTSFVTRHTAPLTTTPEDVPSLGHHYPEPDLALRCAEIKAWRETGIYSGTALQDFAATPRFAHFGDAALRQAEDATLLEAATFLASLQP